MSGVQGVGLGKGGRGCWQRVPRRLRQLLECLLPGSLGRPRGGGGGGRRTPRRSAAARLSCGKPGAQGRGGMLHRGGEARSQRLRVSSLLLFFFPFLILQDGIGTGGRCPRGAQSSGFQGQVGRMRRPGARGSGRFSPRAGRSLARSGGCAGFRDSAERRQRPRRLEKLTKQAPRGKRLLRGGVAAWDPRR